MKDFLREDNIRNSGSKIHPLLHSTRQEVTKLHDQKAVINELTSWSTS